MNLFISQMYFITIKDAFVYDSISLDTLKVTLYPMYNIIFLDDILLIVFHMITIFEYYFRYTSVMYWLSSAIYNRLFLQYILLDSTLLCNLFLLHPILKHPYPTVMAQVSSFV